MNPKNNEMIAGRLAELMEQQWSPFDRPGLPMPVNPTTGKAYRGMNALWLAMQDRQDPRWMTLRQASNLNQWKIKKESKGTLISFLKTTDRVQLLDENGRPQLNSRNKPKTDLIKLTIPVETQAYVFNAEQIEDIPSLEDYFADRQASARLTPAEQLGKLVGLSQAKIENTSGEPGYDPAERIIYMPEPDSFGTPQEHLAALLYELVKFAGHDKELYDPMDVSAAEQARPALAALFLGSEIGIQSQLAPQMNVEDVYRTAADAPQELEAAANDAQYITDYMTGLINSREMRQGARQERFLQVGDQIDYNEKQYEVLGKMRGRDLQVEDKSNGNRFKVSPGDGIYSSLLGARNEALQQQRTQEQVAAQEQILGPDAELDNSIAHEHADELEQEAALGAGTEEEGDLELDLNPDKGENRSNSRKR
jgi:antirestriction protein ArdC